MSNFTYVCPHCKKVQDTVILVSQEVGEWLRYKTFNFEGEVVENDDFYITECEDITQDWVQCPSCNKEIKGETRDKIEDEYCG